MKNIHHIILHPQNKLKKKTLIIVTIITIIVVGLIGYYIYLSKDKIKGINFEINEGKLFVDENKEITLFSDVVMTLNNILDFRLLILNELEAIK